MDNGKPGSEYEVLFGECRPGWTVKKPGVTFWAKSDADAYRRVVDEILYKEQGLESLGSLTLSRVNPVGLKTFMMRWRRGTGWEFMDGHGNGLFEAAYKK